MTEQGAQPPKTNVRTWLRENLGPKGEMAAVAGVILLAVAVVAIALWVVNYQQAVDWKARAQEARAQVVEVEGERDRARAASKSLEGQVSQLKANEDTLAKLALDIEAEEKALAEREAAVTVTEQQVAANTIGEGTWTVGVDVEPGTYRTQEPVTGSCYWAIFRSGTNKGDIVQNDIVKGGSPTVTIGAGQDFETSRCGSWVKQ